MRKNLVQNGRGKFTSGTVEVRRNLCTNPSMRNDVNGWSSWSPAGATVTVERGTGVTPDPYFNAYLHVTSVSPGTSSSWFGTARLEANANIVPGSTYTLSAYVRGSIASDFRFLVDWIGPSGTSLGQVSSQNIAITGTWGDRISAAFVAPDGASYCRIHLRRATSTARQWFHAVGVLFEQSTVDAPFFDGGMSPDPDLTPSWIGTANASASVLTGIKPTIFSAMGGAFLIQSTDDNGNTLHRELIPSTPDTSMNKRVITGGAAVGYTAGQTWFAIGAEVQSTLGYVGVQPCAAGALWFSSVKWFNASDRNVITSAAQIPSTATGGAQWGFFASPVGSGTTSQTIGGGEVLIGDVIAAFAPTQAEALAAVQTYFDGDSDNTVLPSGFVIRRTWDGVAGQ